MSLQALIVEWAMPFLTVYCPTSSGFYIHVASESHVERTPRRECHNIKCLSGFHSARVSSPCHSSNAWNLFNRLTSNRMVHKMTGRQWGKLISEGNALRRNYYKFVFNSIIIIPPLQKCISFLDFIIFGSFECFSIEKLHIFYSQSMW